METKPRFLDTFNQTVIKMQDRKRGIIQEQVSSYEKTQKEIGDHLIKAIPDLDKSIKKLNSTKISLDDNETKKISFGPSNPWLTQAQWNFTHNIPHGGTNNPPKLSLKFFDGSPVNFGNAGKVIKEVDNGVFGWSPNMPPNYPSPSIENAGSSDERKQWKCGYLEMLWVETLPEDRIYSIEPSMYPYVVGEHKVVGDGWYFSDNDARVEVNVCLGIYLDDVALDIQYSDISSDVTKSQNRTTRFGTTWEYRKKTFFKAMAGQDIGIVFRLTGNTWANADGTAAIWIEYFGVMSNWMKDVTYPVDF